MNWKRFSLISGGVAWIGILLLLLFATIAFGAVRGLEFSWVQIGTLACFFIWLVGLLVDRGQGLVWPGWFWFLSAFMVYAVYRWQVSEVEYDARTSILRGGVYFLLMLVGLGTIRGSKRCHYTFFALLGIGAIEASFGIYQMVQHSDRVLHLLKPAQYLGRATGTFANPNHFGGYLAVIAPLAVAYLLIVPKQYVAKIFVTYITVMICVGVAGSFSRGALAALFVGVTVLGVLLVCRKMYRVKGLVLLSLLAVVCVIAVGWLQRGMQSQGRKNNTDVRLAILWPAAKLMAEDHIVTGVGPNHFQHRFRQYRPETFTASHRFPRRVHNDYLDGLVEWGAVGMLLLGVAFLWFVIVAAKPIFKTPEDSRRVKRGMLLQALSYGGISSLVVVVVHSFVDFSLHIPAYAILVLMMMSLVYGAGCPGEDERSESAMSKGGGAFCGVGIISILMVAPVVAREAKFQHQYKKAWAGRGDFDQRISGLSLAHEIEHGSHKVCYEIGEFYRRRSFEGLDGYEADARESIKWMSKAYALNPLQPHYAIAIGMCLDWLGEHDESEPYFLDAIELDPNNHRVRAHMAKHYYEAGEFEKAQEWNEKSLRLVWDGNQMALTYRWAIRRALLEKAKSGK